MKLLNLHETSTKALKEQTREVRSNPCWICIAIIRRKLEKTYLQLTIDSLEFYCGMWHIDMISKFDLQLQNISTIGDIFKLLDSCYILPWNYNPAHNISGFLKILM